MTPITARTPAMQPMYDFAARQSTTILMQSHGALEAKARKTSADLMSAAVIAETIEERHDLGDRMDAIFEDDDYTGTYNDALRQALDAAGVIY